MHTSNKNPGATSARAYTSVGRKVMQAASHKNLDLKDGNMASEYTPVGNKGLLSPSSINDTGAKSARFH